MKRGRGPVVRLADQKSGNWVESEEVVESRERSRKGEGQPRETKEVTVQALQNWGSCIQEIVRGALCWQAAGVSFHSIGSQGIEEVPARGLTLRI